VTRPDDSILDPAQLKTVHRHADHLLRQASALGRFPTPVSDLMSAAKLTVVDDEVLNERFLRQLMKRARAGLETIKSALGKVLGLFDAGERLVVLDSEIPAPRLPFIKLHETAHGTLPHQSSAYKFMHDCEKTLDPEIKDLFEREANVFASEVLFQGDVFSKEAREQPFGIKVPIGLAKKFGASNYSSFRRYVTTSGDACCVVVLDPTSFDCLENLCANVRRIIASKSFDKIYDCASLCSPVIPSHPLAPAIPFAGKRMTFQREVVLTDRNQNERVCIGEALNTTHHVLILVRDVGPRTRSTIIMPRLFRTLRRCY